MGYYLIASALTLDHGISIGSLFLIRTRNWQPDLEACVAGFGAHLNVATVFSHDAFHGVEAEARALAHPFGGEERLADVRQNLRRNSWAVICDLNYHAGGILLSARREFSLARHGINGIIDEVCPYLAQLTAERIHE